MNKEEHEALIAEIEKAWLSRAEAQELGKPTGMKYRRAELEFFMGAITTINALDKTPRKDDSLSTNVPVRWLINVMAGDAITTKRGEKK